MFEFLQNSKTSGLVHVEESPGLPPPPPSSSDSDSLEPLKLRYDIDGRKPSDQRDAPAAPLRTEKDRMDGKRAAASILLGHHSSRDASSRRGLVDQPHTHVAYRQFPNASRLWAANRSYFLVMIAVIFGSAMTLFTKLLETGEQMMHPLLILFWRMSVTSVVCFVPLCLKKAGGSPFGPREVRGLLVIRGLCGFFALAGIWMSIRYLDMADATVITFLTPSMVAIFSALCMKQPFTSKEQLASLLAMLGVVFIARPAILFGNTGSDAADRMPNVSGVGETTSASERLTGTVLALVSATGGAGAFITIRIIGGRANILTTTLYFALSCTVISGMALLVAPVVDYEQPGLRFGLAQGARQWTLMGSIIVCGVLTQFLLTAGLKGETKSNKAPAMVYTGMLWTAGLDRWVLGERMYWSSVVGCALIVGGAVWMVVQPKPEASAPAARDLEEAVPVMMELRQRDDVA